MKASFYSLFTFKRYIEQVIMFPFVLIGKLYARFKPLDDEFDVFLFFPNYSIGGAERINAEVVNALPDKKLIIYFTKRSHNDGMLHFFKRPNVTIKEIGNYTGNKYVYFLNLVWRGIIASYINNQKKKPKVFIGQCNFAYKLTPHLKRSIPIVELIHVHEQPFLWVWAPFLKFIHTRIIVGDAFKTIFENVHKTYGIPMRYLDKYKVIRYCLEYTPDSLFRKKFDLPLKVYYGGRGGHQKRLWILFKIIEKCRMLDLPLQFSLAGSFENEVPEHLVKDGTYIGKLKGGEAMYNFHKEHDILLMTSAFEGFPVVIMEAMSFGSPVIAPPVDAIPENIQHEQNGFIISEYMDEDKMVANAIAILQSIIADPSRLQRISENAFDTIVTKFSKEKFILAYRELLA